MANHLWQSTVFAVVAAGLALLLRRNHARARYWIWMAASLKFMLPLAVLVSIGSHFAKPRSVPAARAGVYVAVEDVSEPFREVQGSGSREQGRGLRRGRG